jgi:ATP-binding cassette subfamily C protein CydD
MKRRLWRELKPAYPLLAAALFLHVCGGVLTVVQAVLIARVVNAVFIAGQDLHHVERPMYLLLGCIVARSLLLYAGEVCARRMAISVKTDLRTRLVDHIQALGPAYSRSERTGELLNTAMDGVEQLEPYLTRYLPQLAMAAFIPVTILGLVVAKDLLAAAILAGTAALIPVFMILIGLSARAVSQRQWNTLSLLSAHFFDVLRGLTTLQLFGRSKAQIETIARLSDQFRRTTMASLRVAFLSSFALELLATLSTAMVAVGIGLRLLHGELSFAVAFLVLLLTPEFYLPIRLVGTEYHASVNGITAAQRIFEILDTQPLAVNPPRVSVLPVGAEGRDLHIVLHDVSYRYPAAGQWALNGVSLTFEPGRTVAVVGPSGSGKSTLLDLVMGFLSPIEGEIRLGGQKPSGQVPLERIPLDWWRRQIAFVPQKPYLFHGTVMDNLRIANPECSLHDVIACANKTGVDRLVQSLPDGYDTIVGEHGARLSGGQIQRIAIARALLKDCPVVIMDEPSAHLDVESEFFLRTAWKELVNSRTAIVVAHRLSTIRNADRIVVLSGGRVVQQGGHDELLQRDGLYRALLNAFVGESVS